MSVKLTTHSPTLAGSVLVLWLVLFVPEFSGQTPGVQLCAVFEVSAGARMPSYLSSACSEEQPGSLHTQSHGDSLYEKIINDPGFWVYCSPELRE